MEYVFRFGEAGERRRHIVVEYAVLADYTMHLITSLSA